MSILTTLSVPASGLTAVGTTGTTLATQTQYQVALINTGLRGPKGDPGGGGFYEHSQPSASDTWTVNHNFGYRPNVKAYSAGGREMWAEILHVSVNQAQVIFDAPASGYAICS